MKWEEMTIVKKILVVLGFICGLAYIVLHGIDRSGLLSIPESFRFPLFSAFWMSMGTTQSNKKLAKWYYFIAAGYALLALLYIFF